MDTIRYLLTTEELAVSQQTELFQKNVHHRVDCFDGSLWDRGLIYRISRSQRTEITYTIHITFQEWSRRFDMRIKVRLSGQDDCRFKERVAPYRTKAFYGWDDPFSVPSRISYFHPKLLRFVKARLVMKDSQRVYIQPYVKRRYDTKKWVEFINSPRVQPYTHSNHIWDQNNQLTDSFALIYSQIAKYNETEKQIEVKNKKILQKKRKEIRNNLKTNANLVVINPATLSFYKQNPCLCLKSCIAFKKGWVNQFGILKSWLNKPVFSRLDNTVSRIITDYMNVNSLSQFLKTNRYSCALVLDPFYMSLFLGRVHTRIKKYSTSVREQSDEIHEHFQNRKWLKSRDRIVRFTRIVKYTRRLEEEWVSFLNEFCTFNKDMKSIITKKAIQDQNVQILLQLQKMENVFTKRLKLYKSPRKVLTITYASS